VDVCLLCCLYHGLQTGPLALLSWGLVGLRPGETNGEEEEEGDEEQGGEEEQEGEEAREWEEEQEGEEETDEETGEEEEEERCCVLTSL